MPTRPYSSNTEAREARDRPEHGRDPNRQRSANYLYKYYDDMGYISSQEQYANWVKGNDTWNKEYVDAQDRLSLAQGKVDTARGAYDAAKAKVPGLEEALGTAWDTARKDWVDINIVNNNQVENTYRLPESAAQEMLYNSSMFTLWDPDKRVLNVDVHGRGDASGHLLGGELHASLLEATSKAKYDFYEASTPKIAESLGETSSILSKAWNDISSADSEVGEARDTLQLYKDTREDTQQDARDQFQERLQLMRETLGEVNFESRGK